MSPSTYQPPPPTTVENPLSLTTGPLPTARAPVYFSANGTNAAKSITAAFSSAGDYQITATVLDAQGLAATSVVNLRVLQTESGLIVSPTSATVAVGASQSFGAVMLDQFGAAMDSPPTSFTWSDNGGGTIDDNGNFTATAIGDLYQVTAGNTGHSSSASVTVTPGSATITLSNTSQTYDGTPKSVIATTVPENLSTAITYDGSPTAPTAIGTYAVAATITDENHTGSATGSLVITPGNDWVSWQYLHFTESEKTAGLAAESADPDSDGLANLAEYALGTDPRAFTPPFTPSVDETTLSFIFTRPAGLPGITYAAEFSDDAITWFPAALEMLTSGPMETLKASTPLPPDEPHHRFLRLHFEHQ